MYILYSKYSNNRKPQYRLSTQIQKEPAKNKIIVIKKADSIEASKHLLGLITNEKTLNSILPTTWTVIHGTLIDKTSIRYPFVSGDSITDTILKLVIDRNFIQAKEELDNAMGIFSFFPTITSYPKTHSFQYKSFFGFKTDKSETFVSLSNLDITPDNIIKHSTSLQIIDCEWSLGFPVELGYIKYRFLLNLSKNLTPFLGTDQVFEKHQSLGFNNLVLPDTWISQHIKIDNINKYAQMEYMFQKNVTVLDPEKPNQPIPNLPQVLSPALPTYDDKYEVLLEQHKALLKEYKSLDNKLASYEKYIISLESVINLVKNTRYFILKTKLKNLWTDIFKK